MKVKLFDESEITCKSAVESKGELVITIPLAQKSDYADIFAKITDANLSAVKIISDDKSESTYNNLKFVSASLLTGSKYSVLLTLSNKSEFEMRVGEIEKELNSDLTDLTKTQLAIIELYELLIPLLSL